MGLFDRKKKADSTSSVESQDACAQASESQESKSQVVEPKPTNTQLTPEPTELSHSVAEHVSEQQLTGDAQSSRETQESDQQVAEPQSADTKPAPDPKPAPEWSAPVEPSSSGQLAKEPAMSAPSLEHVIVTKSRDLSRLSREDLLQLLLTQSKDAERLQDYLRDVADEFERCTNLNVRLREKLDAKDEQIERLKGRLDDKDKRIARMQARLDELEVSKEEERKHARIIVNAAEGVRGALEAFNVTADWYIASLQEVCGDIDSKYAHAAPLTHTAVSVPTDGKSEPTTVTPPVAAFQPASAGDNAKVADE